MSLCRSEQLRNFKNKVSSNKRLFALCSSLLSGHPRKSPCSLCEQKTSVCSLPLTFVVSARSRLRSVAALLKLLRSSAIRQRRLRGTSPRIITRASFVMVSARVVRVLALLRAPSDSACRAPGPPSRLSVWLHFDRSPFVAAAAGGSGCGGYCRNIVVL